MVPSVDPLPFKLLLGYKSYPTETNYVAMTEMPQKGTTLGNFIFIFLILSTQRFSLIVYIRENVFVIVTQRSDTHGFLLLQF